MTEQLIGETQIGIALGLMGYCVLLTAVLRTREASQGFRIAACIAAGVLPFMPLVFAFIVPVILGRSADGPSNVGGYLSAFYFWVVIFPSCYVIERTKPWEKGGPRKR